MVKRIFEAFSELISGIWTERNRRGLKARPIVSLEQSHHQISHGMIAKIGREISDTNLRMIVMFAVPHRKKRGWIIIFTMCLRTIYLCSRRISNIQKHKRNDGALSSDDITHDRFDGRFII